jgi:CheY-like chemotaxis protein
MARILLVDDDEFIHRITGAVLREHGHTVAHAMHSGEAEIALDEEGPFDIIICDNNMKQTDEGLGLGALLYYQGNDTPFILHTKAERRELPAKELEKYSIHYAWKDAPPEVLLAKIDEILNTKSATP